MSENWKDIVGYEGLYQVSNRGNVRSLPKKTRCGTRLLKLNELRGGYLYVNLYKGASEKVKKTVHVLVAEAFIGERREGLFVCHNDGNKHNNTVENLRYDTAQNNQADRIEHGTSNRGVGNPSAKLQEADVRVIRAMLGTNKQIAKMYSVSASLIAQIKRRDVWSHIS